MAWYVTSGGDVGGPFDDDSVVEAIKKGLRPTARICEVGSEDWRDLASHAPFAEALRNVAPPPPPPPPLNSQTDRSHQTSEGQETTAVDLVGWALVLLPALGGVLGAILGKGLLFLLIPPVVVLGTGILAGVDASRLSMRAWKSVVAVLFLWLGGYPVHLYQRGRRAPKRLILGIVSMLVFFAGMAYGAELGSTILTNATVRGMGEATVSFTNVGFVPGSSCVRAVLTRLEDRANIESDRICSGRVPPGETVNITAAGFPEGPVSFCLNGATSLGIARIGKKWTDYCALTTRDDRLLVGF